MCSLHSMHEVLYIATRKQIIMISKVRKMTTETALYCIPCNGAFWFCFIFFLIVHGKQRSSRRQFTSIIAHTSSCTCSYSTVFLKLNGFALLLLYVTWCTRRGGYTCPSLWVLVRSAFLTGTPAYILNSQYIFKTEIGFKMIIFIISP